MYDYIRNEITAFGSAVIGDFVDLWGTFGQKIASDDKIFCTEIAFVEDVECSLDTYAIQTISTPASPRFTSITSRMKLINV